jgi:dUTP pyrophosphatase
MKIKLQNSSRHSLPSYQTVGSAGMDLHAAINESITITPGARVLVPTGVHLELPHGYEAQLRPRSGLAFKHGITILNTPATIDSDYRGELKALLINHGTEDFVINDGDRICQLVIAKHENVEWELVDSVEENTERGKSGFGHTGT